MADERCPECGNAGWVLDCNPTRNPIGLELLPCLIPDCKHSGRAVDTISVFHAKFRTAHHHPNEPYIMSLTIGESPRQPQQQPPPQQMRRFEPIDGEHSLTTNECNEMRRELDSRSYLAPVDRHILEMLRQREQAPQQEQGLTPLAQALANDDPMGALQALETDGVIGEIDPDDANLMLPICTAVAELLEQARADERARVVGVLDDMVERAEGVIRSNPRQFEKLPPKQIEAGIQALKDLRQRLGGWG